MKIEARFSSPLWENASKTIKTLLEILTKFDFIINTGSVAPPRPPAVGFYAAGYSVKGSLRRSLRRALD